MNNHMFPDSKAAGIMKKFLKRYHSLEAKIEGFYESSVSYDRILEIRRAFKTCLNESFLMKITQAKKGSSLKIADSRIASRLVPFVNKKKEKAAAYFSHSIINGSIRYVKTVLRAATPKTMISIGVAALITNMVISLAIKMPVGPFGWTIRVAFTLLGIVVLSSDIHAEGIRETSIFAGFFMRRKKISGPGC
ncbi:MAG: hypothetical protein PHX20_00140 [Candidatus Omnitrophica bacterium]|nr:hypothetical protein [Candidatus Omnitrophota bacterium]MDD5435944.1 hypothetical protein [Candidatus Omnitrophota bacterium]